jgi:hypothetical protein
MKKTKEVMTRGKDECCSSNVRCGCKAGCGGAVYGLGFVGALIYYIQVSTGFWSGVLGILKAIVWPAFAVHGLMKFLGA